ncbi:MAG: ASCH domain-containing protein [Alphaproteobacteria bacterium]|nr:ASCH domain-containing protein [Alphaproteobacteria bacterium]
MSAEFEAFWAAACKAVPGLTGPYKTKLLTSNREVGEHLLERIIAGKKKGTISLPWLHGREPGAAPAAGQLIIYVDVDQKPRALVRQAKPEFVAYSDVTDAHTAVEGEGSAARFVDTWRKIHEPHYTHMLAAAGLTLGPDTPLAVERFEILYPRV